MLINYKKSGFTLVELMFALFILIISAISILLIFFSSAFLLESSRGTTTAVNDAKTVMEEIRRTASTSLAEVTDPDANWPGWAVENGCNTLFNETIQVSFVDQDADPLDVTVTVSWQDRTRSRSLDLRQLVTRR